MRIMNLLMNLLLLVMSIVCLPGCSTPQEQAYRQQADMDRMIGEFGPACYQLGYPQNSDRWRDCVMQLAARHGSGRGSVSTSFFGTWSNWGRGSGVGAGVSIGR